MGFGVVPAGAQLNNILNYGSQVDYPTLDELGFILPGTAQSNGAIVQIIKTTPNMGIIKPDTNGIPHPSNTVIHIAYMGEGTDLNAGTTGNFAGQMALDRTISHHLFARVFNRQTVADSSFYKDSRIYVTPTDVYGQLLVEIEQTNIPLDDNDDDEDGLSNSWEKSLGTDRSNPDTDDDGFADYTEFLAGTNPLDGDDFLQMVELIRIGAGDMMIQWSSVAGMTYQVEYATNQLNAVHLEYFNLYDPVTAAADETSLIFTNGALLETPHIRVRLVLEE